MPVDEVADEDGVDRLLGREGGRGCGEPDGHQQQAADGWEDVPPMDGEHGRRHRYPRTVPSIVQAWNEAG